VEIYSFPPFVRALRRYTACRDLGGSGDLESREEERDEESCVTVTLMASVAYQTAVLDGGHLVGILTGTNILDAFVALAAPNRKRSER
jgi:hypothetical protein